MQRDLDLCRAILLRMEEHPHGFATAMDIAFRGHTKEQVLYHCHLLMQAGLIEAEITTSLGSASPEAEQQALTHLGHDFLDVSRDSKAWAAVKDKVIGPGAGAALSVVLDWLKAWAKSQLGLP